MYPVMGVLGVKMKKQGPLGSCFFDSRFSEDIDTPLYSL